MELDARLPSSSHTTFPISSTPCLPRLDTTASQNDRRRSLQDCLFEDLHGRWRNIHSMFLLWRSLSWSGDIIDFLAQHTVVPATVSALCSLELHCNSSNILMLWYSLSQHLHLPSPNAPQRGYRLECLPYALTTLGHPFLHLCSTCPTSPCWQVHPTRSACGVPYPVMAALPLIRPRQRNCFS